MATNTYVALQTQTITSAVSEVIFSSIPQGYTDLILVAYNKSTGGYNPIIRVGNGSVDTGSNYSETYMNSASPYAGSSINRANMFSDNITTSNFMPEIYQFMNYSNTTTYKTFLWRHSDTDSVSMWVGNWRSTSAIDTISITYGDTSNAMIAGITFTLYGIKAQNDTGTKATGGVLYTDATYAYHVFTNSGNFVPSTNLTADVLIVAGGGGGGGMYTGGGGGAGGLRAFTSQALTSGTNYPCIVGAGGKGGLYAVNPNGSKGLQGNNTTFNSLSVTGGGGGASWGTNPSSAGGSGGGGSPEYLNGGAGNSGGYTPVEGYAGGQGRTTPNYGAAGGGGAGGSSANASSGVSSAGGPGTDTYNSINFSSWLSATNLGVSGKLAGGGGGGGNGNTSAPPVMTPASGTNGGGDGSAIDSGGNGIYATGGGGGGAGYPQGTAGVGGNGAGGLIIIRYAK